MRSRKLIVLLAIVGRAFTDITLHYLSAPPLLRPTWFEWSPEIITVDKEITFRVTLENIAPWAVEGTAKAYLSKIGFFGDEGEKIYIGEAYYQLESGGRVNITISTIFNESGFHRLFIDIGDRAYIKQIIHVYDPDNKKDRFTFAFFADNRPGGPLTPQPEQFKKLIRILNIIKPDFAILGGDIVYGYRSEAIVLAWQWRDFLSVIEASRVPILIAPGNHEVKTGEAPNTGDIDAQTILLMNIGRLYHAFAYGNSLFVLLNTDLVGEANNIMGRQRIWLEDMLDEGKEYTHIFTFMHKPAYSGPHFRTITNDKEITQLFRNYNVTIAFQGHNHIYYRAYKDPTWFYVSGGAGSPLYVAREEGAIYHMLLVEIDGGNVDVKVIPTEMFDVNQDPPMIKHGFTEEIVFTRDDESWVADPKPVTVSGLVIKGEYKDVLRGEEYRLIKIEYIEVGGSIYTRYIVEVKPGGWVEVRV